MDRISGEAYTDDQTLPKNKTKKMKEKAKLKREIVQGKRDQFLERKKRETQLKPEARQREPLKIMMLIVDDERRKRQEEDKKRQEVISICKKIGDISIYHTGITRSNLSASELLGSTVVIYIP